MVALFHITEIEPDGKKILIDGLDVATIGLNTLQLNLSIIPQDPVMFSNTVTWFGTTSTHSKKSLNTKCGNS